MGRGGEEEIDYSEGLSATVLRRSEQRVQDLADRGVDPESTREALAIITQTISDSSKAGNFSRLAHDLRLLAGGALQELVQEESASGKSQALVALLYPCNNLEKMKQNLENSRAQARAQSLDAAQTRDLCVREVFQGTEQAVDEDPHRFYNRYVYRALDATGMIPEDAPEIPLEQGFFLDEDGKIRGRKR